MNQFLDWIKSTFKNKYSVIGTALFVLGLLIFLYAVYLNFSAHTNRNTESISESAHSAEASLPQSSAIDLEPESSSFSASSQPESESIVYPTDRLFLTKSRQDYTDGKMVLRIPRLELEVPVMGGTDDESLKKGVGLYEYAQLPGESNCNVSIAGHRDIYGCEFYYIDQITDGDLLYLEYNGTCYTYEYKQTEIVAADDWGPIYSKDFSCLTLTSCHPIGTSQKRMIVTAELISSAPL